MLRHWLQASRPRTLVAAVVPVVVGTAYAAHSMPLPWGIAACALLSALCIQIGTNLANDYSDFKKGADTHERLGPTRVTQAGLIAPESVKRGAIIVFTLAVAFGIPLILRGGWPILAIGLLSILFGWMYTGGPYPLGYHGLGEIFVFLFFGLAAVAGSHYVLTLRLVPLSLLIATAPGLHATAILAANNVRDVDTDRAAGKHTLAARWGRTFGRIEYLFCLLAPFLIPIILYLTETCSWYILLTLLTLPLTISPIRLVMTRTDGPGLIRALGGTARLQLIFGILFAIGLWV